MARATRNGATSDCPLARRSLLSAHQPAAAGAQRPRIQREAGARVPEAGQPVERAAPDVRRRVGEQRALDRRRRSRGGRVSARRAWARRSRGCGAGRRRPPRARPRAPRPARRRRRPGTAAGGARGRRPAPARTGTTPPAASTGSVASTPMPVSSATAAKPRGVSPETPRKALTFARPELVEHVARDAQLAAQRLAVDLRRGGERGRVGRIDLARVPAGHRHQRTARDAARDHSGGGGAQGAHELRERRPHELRAAGVRRGSGSAARSSRAPPSCARAARAPPRRAAPARRARRAAARAPSARRRARRRDGSRRASPPRSAAARAICLSRRWPPLSSPRSGTWTRRVKKAVRTEPMPARTAGLGATARNVPPWRA